ncbi:hypothetical protein BaRGS_00029123 [Batillaria attramentaria]|uniref:Glutamate receptor 1 n=1 Tax=Batillaria attramentaria TaxID=370345 RepID=A0ABD0JY81_9CAEN
MAYDDQELALGPDVCRMVNQGIAAMFGPISSQTATHVQSMCNAFEIPHLQWHWDARDTRDYFSISLYPHYLTLSRAYRDVIRYWGWERFTVLYEDNDGLTRVQEVLKAADQKPAMITVRKLQMVNNDYVNLLKDLKDKGEYRFIIDCNVDKVRKILYAALKVRMISDLFHYFFTTLDLGLVDLDDFKHGGPNITAYRLINPDNPSVVSIRTEWLLLSQRGLNSPLMEYSEIETETALAYDAYFLFARALHEYSQAQEVNTIQLSCDKIHTWRHGNSLLNYMKSMDFEGLSGRIRYENGERYDFKLDLLHLTQNGLIKYGTWDRTNGLNITESRDKLVEDTEKTLANSTVRVVVYVAPPYVMKDPTSKSGYRGFCIDLLDRIAQEKKFNYTVYETNTYGSRDPVNDTWNGIMGELRAEIGLGGMTITLDREKAVDFTKPFLTVGITILYRKPVAKPPDLFSFLNPLSIEVWVYMIAAYLCVSFMLFVIARFSPYEWCNPHPCNPDTDEVENQFTILNSLWFTIGSLMQQGCEIAPRAISTRMVAGMWWFFTLIMISSYTANLAAFLTVERMESDVSSAEDLAKQTTIKYGTFKGGSTSKFFEDSNIDTFKRMWNFMSTQEDVFVEKGEMGVQKVKAGGYAYLAESSAVEYAIARDCDLTSIGGNLDTKGYGIATPTDSPLREILTTEILRLKELQVIHSLKEKWWNQEDDAKQCEEEKAATGSASELTVDNVGGVFVVLMGGVVVGFFVAMCEFMWKARKNARKDQQTLCSEMAEEFRFAVRCFGSKKPVKKREQDITDNGLQFMPLTGNYGQNSLGKEVFA